LKIYSFKAKGLKDHKTDKTIENTINQEPTIVFTDQSILYVNIADFVEMHINLSST